MHNGDAPEASAHSSGYSSPVRAPRGFKETWLVPLLIPVLAALTIFVIILSVSQILLAVPASGSTAIAMVIALLILLTCAYLSSAPKITRQLLFSVIGVPALILFTGGIIAGIYRQENPTHETAAAGTDAAGAPDANVSPAAGAPGGLIETTTDNKFSLTSLSVNSGEQVTLTLQNKGAALHNFHVLGGAKNTDGNDVKTAELVAAGQSATITFQIGQPGSYPFQCDVHPTEMKGTLIVK